MRRMASHIGFLTVNELLTHPVILSPAEHVHRAIGLLEKMRTYELFVVEKGEVKGLLTIRGVLKTRSIAGSKVSSLITRVPHLSRNDTVSTAARIMTEYRVRAVPIMEDGKLTGR